MKNIYKAGALAAILVIPALVFIFLKVFGKNHYDLPVYFASDSTKVNGQYIITQAHCIPGFQFQDQNGNVFDSRKLKGQMYVADFFFTRCGGICPKMTTQLTRVQEAFLDNPQVQIVSFTVDPTNDTAEVLKSYAHDFKADSTKWTFLTGTKDSIYHLAQKGFFVTAMEEKGIPDFIHSEKLILVDKKGWVRGYYNGTKKEDVDRLIREIQVLVYQHEHETN